MNKRIVREFEKFKFELWRKKTEILRNLKSFKFFLWDYLIVWHWYGIFLPRDESHFSLSINDDILSVLSIKYREKYFSDLDRRRSILHLKSL